MCTPGICVNFRSIDSFLLCCRSNTLEGESLAFEMFVMDICERQEERTGLGGMSCWTLMLTDEASLTWQGALGWALLARAAQHQAAMVAFIPGCAQLPGEGCAGRA